jgi:predicted transposase YdaD
MHWMNTTTDSFDADETFDGQGSTQTREDRIQSPHDRLLNQTLQKIDAARTLLANHLPREVVEHLELDTLARVDTSFIDQNLRRRFADRLFSVEVSDEVVQSLGMKTNYVYSLTLLKYGREAGLEAALRRLFEELAEVLSLPEARDLLDTLRVYVMSVSRNVKEETMSELVSEFWPVQPEPGSVADQLIKKGEARGEARGEAIGEALESGERGEARASANTIRMLQSLLGVPESSNEELSVKSLEELQATIEKLRQQLSSRPGE